MKTMKKVLSLVLVLVMAMGLNLTVFAAGAPLQNGALTVTGAQLSGKEVTLVRIFTANVDDTNKNNAFDNGESVSYQLEDAWRNFFDQQVSSKVGTHVSDDEAYQYVKNLTPEEKLIAFAKKAKDHYNQNKAGLASLETKKTADSHNTATFAGLKTGYYLVLPANGSTGTNRATDAMIVNVVAQNATNLEIKTEYPTVDKKIVEGEANKPSTSAQIGDALKFQLTAKVPNMAEFDKYFLSFKDVLSQGLSLNENSIKVSVTAQTAQTVTELIKSTDYQVAVNANTPEPGKTSMSITIENLKTLAASKTFEPGDIIKVEYTATLNEKAQAGAVDPSTNKAELEYSTNPDGNEHGTSTPSETKIYTFETAIHKYADNQKNVLLPGAVFQLYTDPQSGVAVKLYRVSEKEYHIATAEEITKGQNIVDSFTTVDSGNIVIKGLKAGKCQLKETSAPVGYNLLTKPVEFEIQTSYEADGSLSAGYPKYIVGGGKPSTDNVINIQNKNGAFLPETGSIGTIGLTVLGVALVVGGLGFTSRKKKKEQE